MNNQNTQRSTPPIIEWLQTIRHYPPGLILRRMVHEWRLLALLLFAISLITGFFALGPLYLTTVSEVDLRAALGDADENDLKIRINSNAPLTTEDQEFLEDEFGDLLTDVERYVSSNYSAPTLGAQGIESPGISVQGFTFTIGTDPDLFPPGGNPFRYQFFGYENLDEKVTVVSGRLPERGPTPETIAALSAGLSEAELQDLQLGFYRRWDIEAVVTSEIAETANLEVGARFFVGDNSVNNRRLSRVIIVGIVEAVDPDAPYWTGMGLTGALVDIDNNGTQRFEHGVIVQPDAYNDWIAPVLPPGINTSYRWDLDTDPTFINSDNSASINESLNALSSSLSGDNRAVLVTSGLGPILSRFENRIDEAQGPIVLLSGAVLVLLLYHLVTTVALVLQEQGREWSTITSRGGSTLQLFELQGLTILILAIAAAILGPFISRIFMVFLEATGPLASALGDGSTDNIPMPDESYYLSIGAALASLIVLSFPAIPAARQSLLRLKQMTSRPPTMPTWSKFALDFILIIVGAVLLLRLYWLSSDENTSFGTLLNDLFSQPDEVIKFVADSAVEDGGLSDPLNLIAPALMLTGFALLWLRIFPLMVRLISWQTSRSNFLATPMAIWNVERNPGHYAQLVLLLIGTLALGTASLGLQQTREDGNWNAAQMETGGMLRADLDIQQGSFADTSWERLDGVEAAVPIISEAGRFTGSGRLTETRLIGLEPDGFSEAFPDFADDIDGLENIGIPRTGLELADDALTLEVQVWSSDEIEFVSPVSDSEARPAVTIFAYVIDAHGVPSRLALTQQVVAGIAATTPSGAPAPTPTEQWITFSAALPEGGIAPYRLFQVEVFSFLQGANYRHSVLLDFWQTVDVNGTASPVVNQEASDRWALSTAQTAYPLRRDQTAFNRTGNTAEDVFAFVSSTPDGQAIFDGQNALQMNYAIAEGSNLLPGVGIDVQQLPVIPAIVSPGFTRSFRIASRTDAPDLQVGDTRVIDLRFDSGVVQMEVEIVGIIDEFMTVDEQNNRNDLFFIVPLDAARVALNQPLVTRTTRANVVDTNQIWFALEDRQATDSLESQLSDNSAVTSFTGAYDRYTQLLREPVPSGVAGMLFAGFWISFILSLLDFAFYIAVTAKQRSFTFGVLRSLGWDANNIWRMLLVEQITLVIPALIVGSLLGAGLAYLLLPFLSLVGGATLRISLLNLLLLMLTLVAGFVILLVITALWLRQMSINQVLRLGEE